MNEKRRDGIVCYATGTGTCQAGTIVHRGSVCNRKTFSAYFRAERPRHLSALPGYTGNPDIIMLN